MLLWSVVPSVTVSAPWAGPPRPPSWACSLHPPLKCACSLGLAPSPAICSSGQAPLLRGFDCALTSRAHSSAQGPAQSSTPKTCLPPPLLSLGDPSLPHPHSDPPPTFPSSENGVTSHPGSRARIRNHPVHSHPPHLPLTPTWNWSSTPMAFVFRKDPRTPSRQPPLAAS